jgi:hypothetical protein
MCFDFDLFVVGSLTIECWLPDRTIPPRGFGLALARGDLFFLAVFGVASAMTISQNG